MFTYRDTFDWNGSHVSAANPYWTYWKAWYTAAWSVEPGTSHVTNWGTVSYSQGYLNTVYDLSFGTVSQNLSGSATMYDNGYWTATIQQ